MLCSGFLYGSVGDWGVDLSDCFNGLVTGGVYFLGSEMSIVGPPPLTGRRDMKLILAMNYLHIFIHFLVFLSAYTGANELSSYLVPVRSRTFLR